MLARVAVLQGDQGTVNEFVGIFDCLAQAIPTIQRLENNGSFVQAFALDDTSIVYDTEE